jgi:adenylyl-sulfate kinase
MTGLSGAGKTTLANSIKALHNGIVILDGDELRKTINKDLGFDANSRTENVRRVAEIAKLFNSNGKSVIVSLISPFEKDREIARNIVGIPFKLCYVKCPLETCESRDVKGLYKKARDNQVSNFTGITSKYEEPYEYDIVVDTSHCCLMDCILKLDEHLMQC